MKNALFFCSLFFIPTYCLRFLYAPCGGLSFKDFFLFSSDAQRIIHVTVLALFSAEQSRAQRKARKIQNEFIA